MLDRYSKFLIEFDEVLKEISESQKKYIKCKKGCSLCCERGEYPFSQLEFSYMTRGYINLPENTKILVQQNIRNLILDKKEFKGKNFEYKCPFLINGECCIYEYRGIICRTFGLCYYDDLRGYVRLPGCVHHRLNFADYYDEETDTLSKEVDVPMINLRIDSVLNSELSEKYKLESGEIRPLIGWFEQW